ncbi:MAG: 3-hydroxyacyl-CoA dehydrogenase [Rhizobiales bacterium TMED143]|nr:3-hydroxyacyl-CoA dehydrogenase [Rhodobiaceae bacterium]OUV92978.1 MAG: 3-hydroxyacyl-CoA dehydrogenase [Rhizobiales bacterium TMED143]
MSDAVAYMNEATQTARVIDGLPENLALRPIEKVGIIGAGTMGGGIAMNFATAGISLTIVETKEDALSRGLGVVRGNYQRSADRGRFPQEEVDIRMDRITGALAIDALADCDLVIEAVFEDMDLKKQIFARLDDICKEGAILATNTSALNIDEIAAVTSRPQDVIGLHFFSPANVMKLLEIVRADHTADDVVATSMALAVTIGKVATLVGVCPGFVGNRILAARQREAQNLVNQGVLPWDVDNAFNAFGFKMGPFQMSDLAGLDIGWKKGAVTGNPIRDRLCEMDRRGQKTGAGYYDYDENRQRNPSKITEEIIADVTGIAAGASGLSQEDILARLLHPMVNEALVIMEENKAQRPSDIDVIWSFGYGWPGDTGGPMFYGDLVGAEKILSTMQALAANNEAVRPAKTLEKLAKDGGKFVDLDLGGLKTG